MLLFFAQLFLEEIANIFVWLCARHVLLRARDENWDAASSKLRGDRAEQLVQTSTRDDKKKHELATN